MQRNKKTVSLIYLACGTLAGIFVRELVQAIWVAAGIPLPLDWLISPTDMIAAAAGIAVFLALLLNVKVNEFTNEVITELGRVVWPDRKETVLSTGVVSALVGICAMLFFVIDMVWGSLVKVFYQ